jgi:hypothetical protein
MGTSPSPSKVFAVRLFDGEKAPDWVPDRDANGKLDVRRWPKAT